MYGNIHEDTSQKHKDYWKGTLLHEMFHVFGIGHREDSTEMNILQSLKINYNTTQPIYKPIQPIYSMLSAWIVKLMDTMSVILLCTTTPMILE